MRPKDSWKSQSTGTCLKPSDYRRVLSELKDEGYYNPDWLGELESGLLFSDGVAAIMDLLYDLLKD